MTSSFFELSAGHVPIWLLVILLILPLWANKWSLPILLLLASPVWMWLLIGTLAGGLWSGNWVFAFAGAGCGFLLWLLVDKTGLRQYVLRSGGRGASSRKRAWLCSVAGGCVGWLLSCVLGADVSPGKMSLLVAGGALLGCIVSSLVGPAIGQGPVLRRGKAVRRRRQG